MHVVRLGTGAIRTAPFENGPRVEVLVGEHPGGDRRLAAAHVVVPPGGVMPEHDHGESEAIVALRQGRVVLQSGERRETLEPGSLAVIGVGERVSLANAGSEPASLLAFFAPPAFVRTLTAWPAAEATPQ